MIRIDQFSSTTFLVDFLINLWTMFYITKLNEKCQAYNIQRGFSMFRIKFKCAKFKAHFYFRAFNWCLPYQALEYLPNKIIHITWLDRINFQYQYAINTYLNDHSYLFSLLACYKLHVLRNTLTFWARTLSSSSPSSSRSIETIGVTILKHNSIEYNHDLYFSPLR